MDLSKEFSSNRDLEEDGVEIDMGDGASITIRRQNSSHARKVNRRLQKPYLARLNSLPEKIADQINIRYVAEGLIVSWKGLMFNGEDLGEYTVEKGVHVLTELYDLREFVLAQAMNLDNFRDEDIRDAEGN